MHFIMQVISMLYLNYMQVICLFLYISNYIDFIAYIKQE